MIKYLTKGQLVDLLTPLLERLGIPDPKLVAEVKISYGHSVGLGERIAVSVTYWEMGDNGKRTGRLITVDTPVVDS